MDTLYVILYLLAAVCFLVAAFGPSMRTDDRVAARVNLLALGLLFWVLVPLFQQIDSM